MSNVGAFILIQSKIGSERDVYNKLQELDEVEHVNELFGEWDLIAKIGTDSTEHLDGFLSDIIRKIEGVKLTSTIIISR